MGKYRVTTGKEIIEYLKSMPADEFRCPECWRRLDKDKEGNYYCPNEICLCEDNWDEKGDESNK